MLVALKEAVSIWLSAISWLESSRAQSLINETESCCEDTKAGAVNSRSTHPKVKKTSLNVFFASWQ